jgi:DNA replication licensing factor MCM4
MASGGFSIRPRGTVTLAAGREHHDRSEGSEMLLQSEPLHYGSESQTAFRSSSQFPGANSSLRSRVDIHTDGRMMRQVRMGAIGAVDELDPKLEPSSQPQSTGQPQLVVWGTDVSISECRQRFRRFLHFEKIPESQMDSDELQLLSEQQDDSENRIEQGTGVRPKALYLLKLHELFALEDPFLNVNCGHVQSFDSELYRQLVSYPQEVIPAFDMAVNEVFDEMFPDARLPHPINVRPYAVAEPRPLRSLGPEHINQLQSVSGMVIRVSGVIPEMREALFQCSVCSANRSVEVDRGRISEPSICAHCGGSHSFQLLHNRSLFIDKQQVKLQEAPDEMPAGQTPYTVLLYACADLVDAVQPGDRVTVTGIYRATPVRANPRMRSVKAVYRTHLDVLHYRRSDEKRLHDEQRLLHFSSERVDRLKALSRLPDVYEQLAHAIAPSIYEHEDVKKGVLLQLFGGTRKQQDGPINNGQAKRRNFRSEINILLCGDPGTSKSQLLRYVHSIVPRGQYTSGKGSSAVGLTAYITKDPDSRQLVLQTGALVLADGGVCCIDEFDKMSEATRSILHEVMEQQTLSIAKAGIVCQLNARTSILAAANPVESQWNKNKTIVENMQLPHTLISRFDLIYLLLDPHDDLFDRRLARHLVSLYYRGRDEEDAELLDMALLRDYIAYARHFIQPRLSKESSKALIDAYVEMRKIGSGRGQISAYPRQLESLIRMSEAHARVRLSQVVSLDDVEEAKRIHREAIKQSATDPASGRIDVSILTTGMSASGRRRKVELVQTLRKLLIELSQTQSQAQIPFQTVFSELKLASRLMVTRELFEDALRELQDENMVVLYGNKFVRLVSAEQ